jgi:cell division protein FtsZ
MDKPQETKVEFADERPDLGAKIKVVGVGGGGGNALNTMIAAGMEGVDFIAANTDVQALKAHRALHKVQLGAGLTKGLGAGANPEIGRQAALEDRERIGEALSGADMVFVTAGMGGGTGTGGAPIIAEIARQQGALTVGVVTKPFAFEGKRRLRQAEEGIASLKGSVDALVVIPNNKLLDLAGEQMGFLDAFRKADEVLLHAVQGIADLITVPGLINVDFADVRTVMSNMGLALMGAGRASGPKRALEAAQQAVSSPLLENVSIVGATGILINVTGGAKMTLFELHEANSFIEEQAHEEAHIIFGSVIDEKMGDEIKITVIATGFDQAHRGQKPRERHRATAPAEPDVREHRRSGMPPPRHSDPHEYAVPAQVTPHPVGAALVRRDSDRPVRAVPAAREVGGISAYEEAEFDIPTFLRRGGAGE